MWINACQGFSIVTLDRLVPDLLLLPSLKAISPSNHALQAMDLLPESKHEISTGMRGLPTAPCSPVEESFTQLWQKSGHIAQKQGSTSVPGDELSLEAYLTPPTSSSSSSSFRESGTTGGNEQDADKPSRQAHIFRPSSTQEQLCGLKMKPLRTCRRAGDLSPLSNITTNSFVHASHLSNPTSAPGSATSESPPLDAPVVAAISSLTSHLEQTKLTDDVVLPRIKNTPPLTPRALSNAESEATKRTSDHANEKSPRDGVRTPQSIPGSNSPVAPPKGKLSVFVSEARGLRPSCNPYAVTVFEWIESVARPSKPGPSSIESEAKSRDQSTGGVSIKRSGSDMGRSMAIPMKSRQSSTTSLNDQRDFRNGRAITNVRWDHVALLYELVGCVYILLANLSH